MNKSLFFGLVIILMMAMPGCNDDDGYSLNDYWVSTATIAKEGTGPVLIITDNGDRLFPSATAVPGFEYHIGQRVWVSYTILGDGDGDIDHLVKVNDMVEILTKGIFQLTPEKEDSIGDDPIRIRDYWFTDNFLTIRFSYGGGATIHYINLVSDVNNPVNEDGLPVLEFRHNRNNDPYNYRMHGTVSFDLSSLKEDEVTSVDFVLKATGFDGDAPFEEVLTFEYGE